MPKYNILDYGVVADGVADDSSAFQALINTTEALGLTTLGTPKAEIYCPAGYIIKLNTGLRISKPAVVDIKSPILYDNSTGVALTIGTSYQWMQYGDFYFQGLYSNALSAMPSSINNSGNSGLQINHMQFSKFRCDTIQGFSKYGAYMNGFGDVFSNQVIQHNHFDFGQITNNGLGLYLLSLDAATSSAQANKIDIQNVYQNFGCIQLDKPGYCATDSNTFNINAMDNSYGAASGGHGILFYGKWNNFRIGYTGTDIYGAGQAAYNSFYLYNTKATGAKVYSMVNDTNSYYQIGGI